MIILGIDPGFGTMGFGVIDKKANGDCVPVDYGVITTPKDESFPVRLAMLEHGLNKLYEKFKPEEISVEELFFSKNVTTGIQVAHARGVILLSAVKYCGKLFEYTPNQIKQALTGYGKADKVQMMHVVQSILRLKSVPRPDDAADALAVALCHAHTSRFGIMYGIK
ncbi:MAG: crossover junction endodeoxyribonuclease RuvC [Roseburia sp.]|nr:crossover junction endodeoxyribonuclease RuvC [Roseburia sp.]